MKTRRQRALIALLSAVLAFTLAFSSCNSLVAPNDIDNISSTHEAGLPGVGMSDNDKITEPSESINDFEEISEAASLDDAQSEEASSEESNGSASEEVSSEVSEMSEEQSVESSDSSEAIKDSEKNKPSTLTPILELGIGDGDYEVGFAKDDYGMKLGPSSFYVNNNEIMIVDYVNPRVLVYRDGKLIDKLETEEIRDLIQTYCRVEGVFDEQYYYCLAASRGLLVVVNRHTEKTIVIDLQTSYRPSNITEYRFICEDNAFYVQCDETTYGESYTDKINTVRYVKIEGENVFNAEPLPEFSTFVDVDACALSTPQKEIKLQTASPNDKVEPTRFRYEGKLGKNAYVVGEHWESSEKDVNGYTKLYSMFYKYSESGELLGNYLWQKYVTIPCTNGFFLGADGELYVICCDVNLYDTSTGKFGIYKVNFGFDDPLPEDKRATSGNQPVKQPSTLTPVIEFGVGDGDHEVGFDYDYFGHMFGPSAFYIHKDELIIVDIANFRAMLYKDGKLVEKLRPDDLKTFIETHGNVSCVFDDEYIYFLAEGYELLAVIDRQTNEYFEIGLRQSDMPSVDRIAISDSEFIVYNGEYFVKCFEIRYIGGDYMNEDRVTRYVKIEGKTISEAPYASELLPYIDQDFCTLNSSETSIRLQTASPDDGIEGWRFHNCGKLGDSSYIACEYWPSVEEDINGYLKLYYMFYKYSKAGKLLGNYLWHMYVPFSSKNAYLLGNDGELYVTVCDVNMKDKSTGKFGIYKVNFGFDEALPVEKRVVMRK